MKILRNEKGIALVMVLVVSLIALVIVSALLYMGTQSTIISGSYRLVKTTDDAAFSGKNIVEYLVADRGSLSAALTGTLGIAVNTGACLSQKLSTAKPTTGDWSACSATEDDTNPANSPDITFPLGNFTVMAKIVDTIAGNTYTGAIIGGGELGAYGVVNPPGIEAGTMIPYTYKIEIQAQATNNPREVSRLSIEYAY